jgi:hypothetical protein
MFKNYLKIAIRNIRKNKLFAAINILGLAVGMACFILISLWVQDELSYDEFYLNRNELYLINIKHPGDLNGYGDPNAPYALAPILAREFPGIIYYTRIEELDNIITCSFKYQPDENRSGQKMFYENNVWRVDTCFFSMFTFPFSRGAPETALSTQNSLVITDKIAKKYFGKENPLGKKLTLNNRRDYMVTGVVHIPANSHLKFQTNRSLFRIVSVVGQFVISILLIVCTTVVFKQLNYIQNRPLGFKTDNVINIPINNELKKSFPGYKNELLRNPNILTVTAGHVIPFAGDFKTNGIEWDNKNPQYFFACPPFPSRL